MSTIRNQLKSQDLDTVIPSAFKQVGGVVYPDRSAIVALNDLFQIVNAYRSVHAVTYGNAIPNTGQVAEGIEDGQGLAATDNQVIQVNSISVTNAGLGALEVTISIGDCQLFAGAIPPSASIGKSDLQGIFPITIVKGAALKFVVTSGTASDFSAKVAYYESVQ